MSQDKKSGRTIIQSVYRHLWPKILGAKMLGVGMLAFCLHIFAPTPAYSVDLSEYLRLEVMSKTLVRRVQEAGDENPDWDNLILPQYREFRQIMLQFMIDSLDELHAPGRQAAMAPPDYMEKYIDWEKLGPSKAPVDFAQVPLPWFNLQADYIRKAIKVADRTLSAEEIDKEQALAVFETLKASILAWPRPPIVIGGGS